MYESAPWDDTGLDQLDTIPHTTHPHPHRFTDPFVIAADKVRLVYSTNVATQHCTHVVLLHTYRIRMPTIYNFVTGQFVSAPDAHARPRYPSSSK